MYTAPNTTKLYTDKVVSVATVPKIISGADWLCMRWMLGTAMRDLWKQEGYWSSQSLWNTGSIYKGFW